MEFQILIVMKKYISILLVIFALLSSGCEKIVDLDLNTMEPRLVIDAYITDDPNFSNDKRVEYPCCVTLSMTQDYYDDENKKTYVSGAQVYLSVDDGITAEEQLVEVKKGVYISHRPGEAGKTYTIRVIVGGAEYKSTATMPETVLIENLFIYSFELDGKYWFTPCVGFQDPIGETNYYLYTLWINGKKMSSIDFDDDYYFDGLYKERLLFFDKEENNDEDLIYGDKVEVEMQSINVGAFTFYQSLYSVASGGGTNPISNFSGGVLGCFKAFGASYDVIDPITEDDVFTREL